MAKTIKIGSLEYSRKIGVTVPAIMYRIKHGRELPGVKSFEFNMKTKKYVFDFDPSMTKEKAQTYFQDLSNFQKRA